MKPGKILWIALKISVEEQWKCSLLSSKIYMYNKNKEDLNYILKWRNLYAVRRT